MWLGKKHTKLIDITSTSITFKRIDCPHVPSLTNLGELNPSELMQSATIAIRVPYSSHRGSGSNFHLRWVWF